MISGDEAYRSEEALTQWGKILAVRRGVCDSAESGWLVRTEILKIAPSHIGTDPLGINAFAATAAVHPEAMRPEAT
ncbi:MAG: hypothetical protein FJ404_18940 [Verrucomicrobia bacterium]|nr:hypothetical protein [Verrucomicrobiota bacterium]